jgi:hypothetical protein
MTTLLAIPTLTSEVAPTLTSEVVANSEGFDDYLLSSGSYGGWDYKMIELEGGLIDVLMSAPFFASNFFYSVSLVANEFEGVASLVMYLGEGSFVANPDGTYTRITNHCGLQFSEVLSEFGSSVNSKLVDQD